MRPQMFAMALRGGHNPANLVNLNNNTLSVSAVRPSTATSGFQLNSDGSVVADAGAVSDWLLTGLGSAYECRATIVSGTLTSGTTGSWLGLGSNRLWSVTRSSLGTKTCVLDIDIGLAGQNSPLTTGRITLSATVTSE